VNLYRGLWQCAVCVGARRAYIHPYRSCTTGPVLCVSVVCMTRTAVYEVMQRWNCTVDWSWSSPCSVYWHYICAIADFPETSLDGKFRGSWRNGIWAKGDITACRGRHGEVCIVDLALLCFGFLWQYCTTCLGGCSAVSSRLSDPQPNSRRKHHFARAFGKIQNSQIVTTHAPSSPKF